MIQITRNPITTVVSYSFAPDAALANDVLLQKSGILLNERTGTTELVLTLREFSRWKRLMRPVALYCVHCGDAPNDPFWVRQYEIDDAQGDLDCEYCGAKCAKVSGPVANIIPSWVKEHWDAVAVMVRS